MNMFKSVIMGEKVLQEAVGRQLKYITKLEMDADQYEGYLNSIADKIPKNLLKVYNEKYSETEHNRFHDCFVRSIDFQGYGHNYVKASDTLSLIMVLGKEIEYSITFSMIENLSIEKCEGTFGYLFSSDGFFGEIQYCALGINDTNGCVVFEFITTTDMYFCIEFGKVKIKKRIMKR